MIEDIVELLLSVLDYTYCLCFYKIIIQEKWVSKKTILLFFSVLFIQTMKEELFSFTSLSLWVDNVIVIGFLYLNAKDKSFMNFIMAIIIDAIFTLSILMFISVSMEIGVNVQETISFGSVRVLFALSMKVFTVLIFFMLKKPLLILRDAMVNMIDYMVVLLLSFLALCASFVLSNVLENRSIILFSLIVCIIAVFILFLVYKYGVLLKSYAEREIIQHDKQITYDYVKRLEKEHEEVRKIRHDMKNQLQTLQLLLNEKKYNEIEQNIVELTETIDENKVSISSNVYVDALLRQKMKEFSDITFDLEIVISNEFFMNGVDLISLLSNIIDNACEELYRINESYFYMTIKGNKEQLSIKERNACGSKPDLSSRKNEKEHGFGLRIIQEIVDKYEGAMRTEFKENLFEISIFILI